MTMKIIYESVHASILQRGSFNAIFLFIFYNFSVKCSYHVTTKSMVVEKEKDQIRLCLSFVSVLQPVFSTSLSSLQISHSAAVRLCLS